MLIVFLCTLAIGLLAQSHVKRVFMAFNFVTLPVEFDASRRAKLVLAKLGFIQSGPESAAVSQVLNAAASTYVAAFVTSLIFFLWPLLPLLTGRRRD